MKRVVHSLRLPLAALPLVACNGKATRAECTEMLDRYVDMTVVIGPTQSSEEAFAAREAKKALTRGETSYRRVQEQCEAEVSRREFRCAMKAPSPETWQACID